MSQPLRFKNPANGYIVEIESPEFWTFFLGPLFFASKGVWKPMIICVIAAFLTCGFSILVQLIVLPIFARSLFCHHFLMRGWSDVTEGKPVLAKARKIPAPAPTSPPGKPLMSKPSGMSVGKDGVPTYQL